MDFSINTDAQFDDDGIILQSSDTIKEILYWNVYTGKQINNTKEIRDASWHTWESVLGWPVQGIHNGPHGTSEDGEIHAAARTSKSTAMIAVTGTQHPAHASPPKRGAKKATDTKDIGSTNNNIIKLYRFPCLTPAIANVYNYGHTGPIMDVSFVNNDKSLVTVGGNDSCVFQFVCKRKGKIEPVEEID